MDITKAKEIVYNYFAQQPKDDLIAMHMERYGDDELIEFALEINREE